MKDNFSNRSGDYARYRPTYPAALFDYLFSNVDQFENAWDCGTGNGQVAIELAKKFKKVFATDISQSQIDNALQAENIFYSVQPSEATSFPAEFFDLIVVAQAIHWFDFEKFYAEVNRTARKNALICATGYGKVEISPEIDRLVNDFYENTIGKYWDYERKYVDEAYHTIPFPFKEIPAPSFTMQHSWSLEHFTGYLNTWSAVKHFIKQEGRNPVEELYKELRHHWQENEMKNVTFPLLLRVGRV